MDISPLYPENLFQHFLLTQFFIKWSYINHSNENDLVNAFAQFGRIISCTRIATTGIIGFQSVEEASRAVQGANGTTLLGGSVPLMVTFKSQICRAFAQTGRCSWGHRCKFGHNRGY